VKPSVVFGLQYQVLQIWEQFCILRSSYDRICGRPKVGQGHRQGHQPRLQIATHVADFRYTRVEMPIPRAEPVA
jgi:hypothetical protein